jgi:hypothetical protein
MEINQLALFDILRDLTHNLHLISEDVQLLMQHAHTHSIGESLPRFDPKPAEHVDPNSIRVLHRRLDAICQELRNEKS